MAKKARPFKVDEGKVMKSFWYRFSNCVLRIPTWMIFILATISAIGMGAINRWNAAIYSEMNLMAPDEFIQKLNEELGIKIDRI